jgi:hypothetical protein
VRWAGYVALMVDQEIKNAYAIFVGKLKRTTSFRIPQSGWEDNIKMVLK